MLDVGWTEILVIAIVLIIVVGPKDLPQMLRTFGRMMTKMRGMASDFRQQFDEALREADLDDVKKAIGDAQKLNPLNTIRDAVNPLRQMGSDLKADLEKSTNSTSSSTSTAPVAVPDETQKPASAEPVAAVPLKAGPVAKTATDKTSTKKVADATAKFTKPRNAAAKADAGVKADAKPAVKAATAGKSPSAKSKTTKTKKDEA